MSFFGHQAFFEQYYKIKIDRLRKKLLIEYLTPLSDLEKKSLLRQLRLKPSTVEKLLAMK